MFSCNSGFTIATLYLKQGDREPADSELAAFRKLVGGDDAIQNPH